MVRGSAHHRLRPYWDTKTRVTAGVLRGLVLLGQIAPVTTPTP